MATGISARAKGLARPLVHRFRRARDRLFLRSILFGASRPLSASRGFDRGTPIDRLYIEQFLERHSADIRGRVLEVGGDVYSRRFGGDRIERQDILHLDDSNPAATIIGNLADPGLLPAKGFDCIILVQTLQYLFDIDGASRNLRQALRPGGILLMTAPALSPVCSDAWRDSYFWRFSEASVRKLLSRHFDPERVDVSEFGNFFAATAFLRGVAVEEISRRKLEPVGPDYAIIIAARAMA